MRYGAMNAPVRPLLEEVETLGNLGFDYVEVTMDAPFAHFTVLRENKAALLRALDRWEMALVCHLPTFVSTADLTASLREASVQETLQSLRTAAELGATKAVLHPSVIRGIGAMLPDMARQYAATAMARLLEEAGRLDLVICVENMFPGTLSLVRPEDFDSLFAMFPQARLALDTGHAHIGGGTRRILAFIDRFADRIGHIHASDNGGHSDDHLPIGAGRIGFSDVVKRLKHSGYDDTITLEIFSQDRDYLHISREKLAAMFASY
jgi:sugar phosphate isomerase/epimerase